jgi:hypothetical protein
MFKGMKYEELSDDFIEEILRDDTLERNLNNQVEKFTKDLLAILGLSWKAPSLRIDVTPQDNPRVQEINLESTPLSHASTTRKINFSNNSLQPEAAEVDEPQPCEASSSKGKKNFPGRITLALKRADRENIAGDNFDKKVKPEKKDVAKETASKGNPRDNSYMPKRGEKHLQPSHTNSGNRSVRKNSGSFPVNDSHHDSHHARSVTASRKGGGKATRGK